MVELIVENEIRKAYLPPEEHHVEEAEPDLEYVAGNTLDDALEGVESDEPSDEQNLSIEKLYLESEYSPSTTDAFGEVYEANASKVMTLCNALTLMEYFAPAIHEENEVLFVTDLFNKFASGDGRSGLEPNFLD